ncbi:hypothetical protein [Virgisporangium aurantiacum]|uniref:Secreted protein n=1 Tax=Virgisporangium aurantiacum TaxID=175570 RepID=A0A8J3Z4L9_9ACTN|nr:hypothetical protein [Virgisporangium aurantiacum]GIJ57224.1 hypothetical protein Vau01_047400 [Virgisporangium aurantiacum]
MKIRLGSNLRRTSLVLGAAVAALTLAANPAAAAVNDDFHASTTDGCGVVNFIDYGPGAPAGGDNDDYLVIHDYCSDGLLPDGLLRRPVPDWWTCTGPPPLGRA